MFVKDFRRKCRDFLMGRRKAGPVEVATRERVAGLDVGAVVAVAVELARSIDESRGAVERETRARLAKLEGADSAIAAGAIAAARAMDVTPTAALLRELRLTVRSLVDEAWQLSVDGGAARGAGAGGAPAAVDGEGDEDADLARVVGRIGDGGGRA